MNCFLNSLFILFLPSLFLRKNQHPKKSSLLFSPFFVSLFLSTFFLSSFFFDNFSFHLFVHPFLLSSPFFSSILLHSFFISPSQCFSFFFSLPHGSLSVFLHLLFCVSPFLFLNILLFSLLILISLFSHFFFTLFSSSPFLLFSCLNKLKILCGQDENVSFFFRTLLLSDFFWCVFLLASSFFLLCPMFSVFSRFFITSYLDFLLPIFFLGLFQKTL